MSSKVDEKKNHTPKSVLATHLKGDWESPSSYYNQLLLQNLVQRAQGSQLWGAFQSSDLLGHNWRSTFQRDIWRPRKDRRQPVPLRKCPAHTQTAVLLEQTMLSRGCGCTLQPSAGTGNSQAPDLSRSLGFKACKAERTALCSRAWGCHSDHPCP